MSINIDELLKKAESSQYVKAETGKFICKINEIKQTESQAKKPMVQIVFEVTEGEKKTATFSYYLGLGTDKSKDFAAVRLIKYAMNGFKITRERLEEDADTVDDLIANCVGEIQKKLKKVEVLFDVERTKDEGTDFYKNIVNLHEEKSEETKDNFFDDVESKA